MLHTYLMVADGWLVAQIGWPNSAIARRAVPTDTRGRRPAARRLGVGADVIAGIRSLTAAAISVSGGTAPAAVSAAQPPAILKLNSVA